METKIIFYNNKWRQIEKIEYGNNELTPITVFVLKGGDKIEYIEKENPVIKTGTEAEEILRGQSIIVKNYAKPFNGMKESWPTIPKYQHIERMGNVEVEGILEGTVYLQNKLDGANLTVFSIKDETICASRNNIITEGFNGAINYVTNHEGIQNLSKQYILRGEWAVKHTIRYPISHMDILCV